MHGGIWQRHPAWCCQQTAILRNRLIVTLRIECSPSIQGTAPSRKREAAPGYLQRRDARSEKRQPHAKAAPKPQRRRPLLHGVAEASGYEVAVASQGYEGDDLIGAICASVTAAAPPGVRSGSASPEPEPGGDCDADMLSYRSLRAVRA